MAEEREITGNEWVFFPEIDLGSGGLAGLNVLSEGAGGLLELSGLPVSGGQFLAPFLYSRPTGEPGLQGVSPDPGSGWRPVDLRERRWDREAEWLPGWTAEGPKILCRGRLIAPPGRRGALYRLQVTNQSEAPREFTVGLAGLWAETRQTVQTARPVHSVHHARFDPVNQTLVLESRPNLSLLGWALGADKPLSTCVFEAVPVWQAAADSSLQLELGLSASGSPATPWRARLGQFTEGEVAVPAPALLPEGSRPGRAASGFCLRLFLGAALALAPGQTGEVAFFLGVGTDGDGARAEVVDARRRRVAPLHEAAVRSLTAGLQPLNPARVKALCESGNAGAAGRSTDEAVRRLTAVFLRNLTFNRYGTAGRALDTGRLCLVASRATQNHLAGSYQARHAFAWSFPALLLSDSRLAREALIAGLTRYAPNGPLQSSYLDGRPLSPGFALDALAVPLWAFDHYLERTGDVSLWDEPGVAEGLRLILRRFRALSEGGRDAEREGLEPSLRPLKDGPALLLPTFLSPGDYPVDDHPYLTYPNLLAWRALTGFVRRAERRREWEEERRSARDLAQALLLGLEGRLLVGKGARRSFAMATDGQGSGLVMGDHAAGSLALLAYLDFCERTDVLFSLTFAGLNFPGNPFYFPGPFGGRGDRLYPFTSVIARADDLLAGDPTALEFFLEAPLDQGLACETVDPRTGGVRTGAAFAAAAGWLAWCLYQALG